MGFVYKFSFMNYRSLVNRLSETVNILRNLQQQQTMGEGGCPNNLTIIASSSDNYLLTLNLPDSKA